ncbi:hypothetical protein D9M72_553250 [compost metagenome]
MGGFDETALLREGVGVQPFEQIGCVGRHHLHLREMQVRVDEAGHDQVRAMIDFRHTFRSVCLHRGVSATRKDLATLDQKCAVALIAIGGAVVDRRWRAVEAQQSAADEGGGHCVLPSSTALSNQAVSNWRSSVVMSVTFPGGIAWLRPAWI